MMVRKSAGMSDRHRKIMEFLTEFQDEHGYPPSIRQIGESIDVDSTSLVDYYLNQLQEMGYILREKHVSRSIRIVQPMRQKPVRTMTQLFNIPILGPIGASAAPIPMPQSDFSLYDSATKVEIPVSLLGRERQEQLFALEVDGDSMIDAMVNDGDIVILRQAQDAVNGEMVAVWLDSLNATTLKYFYREGKRIRLQPANPTLKPIYIGPEDELRIIGKVVMVIRKVQPLAG